MLKEKYKFEEQIGSQRDYEIRLIDLYENQFLMKQYAFCQNYVQKDLKQHNNRFAVDSQRENDEDGYYSEIQTEFFSLSEMNISLFNNNNIEI